MGTDGCSWQRGPAEGLGRSFLRAVLGGMLAGRACWPKLGQNPHKRWDRPGLTLSGAAQSSSAPAAEGWEGLGPALLGIRLLGMWDGEEGGERKMVLMMGMWHLRTVAPPGREAMEAWGCPRMDQQSHSQILTHARAPGALAMGKHLNICLGASPKKSSLVLQKKTQTNRTPIELHLESQRFAAKLPQGPAAPSAGTAPLSIPVKLTRFVLVRGQPGPSHDTFQA